MIVFGDVTTPVTVAEKTDAVERLVSRLFAASPDQVTDCARAAFIELSELIVALEDAAQSTQDLMPRLWQLGRLVAAAWWHFPIDRARWSRNVGTMTFARTSGVADMVMNFRTSEGYAFYAVYPEAYLEAGRALAGKPVQVVGLRSIGLSLGVMVALGAETRNSVSVRPSGPPFDRRIDLPSSWKADPLAEIAIVDEGPGLSGSSFSAAVSAVENSGAAECRVHLFPSHLQPPGPMASPLMRRRWSRLQKHHVPFEQLYLEGGNQGRLAHAAAMLGLECRSVRDISAGGWRKLSDRGLSGAPSLPQKESRKFLLETADRLVVAKFSGLGLFADAKLARASALANDGWCPSVIGVRDGFMLQPWLSGSGTIEEAGISPEDLIEHVARYLAARTRMLRPCNSGADPLLLARMARQNIAEALGADVLPAFEPILANAGGLLSSWSPTATDNRLHGFEWRATGGRLWKLDAVDHCCSHDLIGCQDIRWDMAGALVELELPNSACGQFQRHLTTAGNVQTEEGLQFAVTCYCAFQIGLWWPVRQDPAATRERKLMDNYCRRLRSIAQLIDN